MLRVTYHVYLRLRSSPPFPLCFLLLRVVSVSVFVFVSVPCMAPRLAYIHTYIQRYVHTYMHTLAPSRLVFRSHYTHRSWLLVPSTTYLSCLPLSRPGSAAAPPSCGVRRNAMQADITVSAFGFGVRRVYPEHPLCFIGSLLGFSVIYIPYFHALFPS
ncbi:hypothetical protein BC834DRAFT_862571 [Gloeopeniophorella convolvens]|nr:hypothetical protein BC834DRAFT_862571 [Gloeopeniophorella convolvens]